MPVKYISAEETTERRKQAQIRNERRKACRKKEDEVIKENGFITNSVRTVVQKGGVIKVPPEWAGGEVTIEVPGEFRY